MFTRYLDIVGYNAEPVLLSYKGDQHIEELLNQSIRKKTHEWNGDQSPIEIRLKSDVSANYAVAIESNEMRSLISNLLNNAFEAKASCVELSLRSSGEQFILDIIDNGLGVVDSIREKLFNEGATAGKPNGTGFGLYHAKKYLKLWNGDIVLISSRAGNTHFRITLHIWKTPQIAIAATDTIVVLDDKPVEINRLKKSICLSGVKNRVVSFTSSIDFLTWYKKHSQPSIALLADYDLGDKSPTGIELIQSLGLKNRSVLVTDNYEDERLYAQCLSLGVLLAPKNNVERLSFFSI
jgi:anti-sigma regulatory factor (Ser/Thr protein kinase)